MKGCGSMENDWTIVFLYLFIIIIYLMHIHVNVYLSILMLIQFHRLYNVARAEEGQ